MEGGIFMSKKGRSFLAVLMMIVMILSQSMVFAEEVELYAVEIDGAGLGNQLKLTLEDLKAMPEEAQIEEVYIYNSKTGEKSVQVKGVSLAYLLKENAGLSAKNADVVFVASDGYQIDPQVLEDVLDEDLKYVLAYELDGEAIDNDDDPETDDIVIYRKLKEDGEFNTVFKLVNKISVGEELDPVEDSEEKEDTDAMDEDEIVFTDITEEYAFAETAIMDLAKRDIIDGMGDGLYAPGGELTRAQFCRIIVDSLDYDKSDYKGGFSDVSDDFWGAEYIQRAYDEGLFVGFPDGTFMPNKAINREEMASVAARAAILSDKPGADDMAKFVMEKSAYLDKDNVSDWAANEVAWLETQGAFEGIASENFNPLRVVNRAEAAVIIYNTLFK